MKNPRNHVSIQTLRLLKAHYPSAIQAVVIENVAPVINRCPGTIRTVLTDLTHKGLVESAFVSQHTYDAGYVTYRLTSKGEEYLDMWLLDIPSIDEKGLVDAEAFDTALEDSKRPDLRK